MHENIVAIDIASRMQSTIMLMTCVHYINLNNINSPLTTITYGVDKTLFFFIIFICNLKETNLSHHSYVYIYLLSNIIFKFHTKLR